jgi:hypothetical protein
MGRLLSWMDGLGHASYHCLPWPATRGCERVTPVRRPGLPPVMGRPSGGDGGAGQRGRRCDTAGGDGDELRVEGLSGEGAAAAISDHRRGLGGGAVRRQGWHLSCGWWAGSGRCLNRRSRQCGMWWATEPVVRSIGRVLAWAHNQSWLRGILEKLGRKDRHVQFHSWFQKLPASGLLGYENEARCQWASGGDYNPVGVWTFSRQVNWKTLWRDLRQHCFVCQTVCITPSSHILDSHHSCHQEECEVVSPWLVE